jgi:hypothetical protein
MVCELPLLKVIVHGDEDPVISIRTLALSPEQMVSLSPLGIEAVGKARRKRDATAA